MLLVPLSTQAIADDPIEERQTVKAYVRGIGKNVHQMV